MLPFAEASQIVVAQALRRPRRLTTVTLPVGGALGYVLAEEILADREYPPFDRSTRDGYAVRSSEAAANSALPCAGEIKAGDAVPTPLAPGTCMQIMTGAAVPTGADAVVMAEFTRRSGAAVSFEKTAQPGENIVPRGSEVRAGTVALQPGLRLGSAELGIAAQIGAVELRCAKKPRVAILSTGDEVVPITERPGPFHIRDSNSASLAAQVRLAGGEPVLLGNARDRTGELGAKIEQGLQQDILALSGGVSMGKYDLVESVLQAVGAEFFFNAVAIRPGKPAVFGRCRDTFIFGLPGNPVSAMVTFLLFVVPVLDVLSGATARPLPLLEATLAQNLREKPGLTHFLPARLDWPRGLPEVRPVRWQGSGDLAALSRSNCFLVVPADRQDISAGEKVSVLPRSDVL